MSCLVQPGFWRRVVVNIGPGEARSAVEDDFHCMQVTLRHSHGRLTAIEAKMERAPWDTCPGAVAQLQATFAGLPLAEIAGRGEKRQNCTHLHDLLLLAASHAADAPQSLMYDIHALDPVEGMRKLQLFRNGERLLDWREQDHRLTIPGDIAGLSLMELGPWIDSQPPALREAARLLRWGAIVAHGRTIPMERQSDASRMPPSCYTFQPDRARTARRVGEVRDFNRGSAQPLDAHFSTPTSAAV